MSDIKFVNGLIIKAPHEKAPDFIKMGISIKVDELIGWLNEQTKEWVNIQVKESRAGKLYAAVDDWKPKTQESQQAHQTNTRQAAMQPQQNNAQATDNEFSDDIPFR